MADEKKRSEHLLSQDAIPKVEIPKTESSGMRTFRMPSAIAKPAGNELAGGPPEAKRGSARAGDDKPAGKRRKPRASTARFRDRTLNWFKTGEALEGEEEIDGDYEAANERLNWVAIAAALAVGLGLAGAIIWLVG